MGPSITLRSTLMWGKRLWAWKTMPLWARRRAVCRLLTCPPKSTSTSPILMTPASGISRALSERSTVVLPEPDGPMSTVTLPAWTSKSIEWSTSWSPKDLASPRTETRGWLGVSTLSGGRL
jgi:hypothetical protein